MYYTYKCDKCQVTITIFNRFSAPIGVYCPNCNIVISPFVKKTEMGVEEVINHNAKTVILLEG